MDDRSWFMTQDKCAAALTAQEVYDLIKTANGRNANFLLNLGPDMKGNLQESSIKVLAEVGKLLKKEE